MISPCGIDMVEQVNSTGQVQQGQTWSDVSCPYQIRVKSFVCNAPDIANNAVSFDILKYGVVLVSGQLKIGFDNSALYDVSKLCLKFIGLTCSDPKSAEFALWWNPDQKELVTNIDIPDTLLPLVGGPELEYTNIRYMEGSDNVYVFNVKRKIVEINAGGSMARFLGSPEGMKIMVAVFLAVTGIVIVWMWRDKGTKQIEGTVKIRETTTDQIQRIIEAFESGAITREQAAASIEEILNNEKKALEGIAGTDWSKVALIAGGAYLVSSIIRSWR